MNKKYTITVGILALCIGGGLTHTSMRIARLESRLEAIQGLLQQSASQQVRYSFNPAFAEYFGERGVHEVLRAVRLRRDGPTADPVEAPE